MKKIIVKCLLVIIVITIVILFIFKTNKDTIVVHIGYQSVTSQTWGALIIKNQKSFYNKLKEEFPNKKIDIIWHDEISGAVINSNMISEKVHIGFMGDMPLLLNMYKSSTLKNYNSKLIAFDGKGTNGKNQSIIIPDSSNVTSIYDLKGKTISTPIGSSAHFMLMKILKKYDMLNKVEIVHQDVALASQLLSNNKIDAFSIWEPYPTSLIKNKVSKVLIDGSESNIDYLAGVIVNTKWADNNPKIIKAFIDCLNEAHSYIYNHPIESAKIFTSESGFEYDVTINEANNIVWDVTITEKDEKTLEEKQKFLIDLKQIEKFDLSDYIDK